MLAFSFAVPSLDSNLLSRTEKHDNRTREWESVPSKFRPGHPMKSRCAFSLAAPNFIVSPSGRQRNGARALTTYLNAG